MNEARAMTDQEILDFVSSNDSCAVEDKEKDKLFEEPEDVPLQNPKSPDVGGAIKFIQCYSLFDIMEMQYMISQYHIKEA